MQRFITDKIIKDRISLIVANGGENYTKYLNKDVMKAKQLEFKQREVIGTEYYDPKIIECYLPHMFKVDADKRADYTVKILWYVEDSFD
jgi:predicted house-cleaning noncanonical NTP pyrophosphatase (MazG superfamily)